MSKRNKIIYWFFTIWMALGMVSTGLGQLVKMPKGQGGADMLTHLGYPTYLLGFLGACKMLGTIVILVPKLPLLKEWAYAGFLFIMVGAMFSHFSAGDGVTAALPALLLLVLTMLSWYFRPPGRKVVFS